ncbi:uncharacterized protein FYW49_006485 [Xenentodon cancila]
MDCMRLTVLICPSRCTMESHLVWYVPCVLSLVIHLSLAAPGLPGTQREESEDAHPSKLALPNPFGSGEKERKLLQSYIQSSLKSDQGGPEISSREQEVFFLFRLYDFDRSGFLDGLEMMKLLSDYNSHHAAAAEANELVVSMVDFLLQTQDLNQDGLLDPSELLSPSFTHTQEKAGAVEHTEEEAHEEIQPQEEKIPNQEVKTGEDEAIQKISEHNEHEIPEAIADKTPESNVHKKIREAFEAFDYESNNRVDVREIGTILYSLGCFPTQAELHDFIAEVEEDDTKHVHLDKFLPAMTKVLLEKKFPPISGDCLLQAFEVLDKEKKGYLELEDLTQYLTQEGEPFTQEEMFEMLAALVDRKKNIICYKDVIAELIFYPDL